MKSCRCLNPDPHNAGQFCQLPWHHEDEFHNSGFSKWTKKDKAEKASQS